VKREPGKPEKREGEVLSRREDLQGKRRKFQLRPFRRGGKLCIRSKKDDINADAWQATRRCRDTRDEKELVAGRGVIGGTRDT